MDLLAEHKVLYLPHLRQVNIMERVEGQLGNTLWELPKRLKPVVYSSGNPSLKNAGFASHGSPCLLNLIRRYGSKRIRHVLYLALTRL
jgi:hypothetical protein